MARPPPGGPVSRSGCGAGRPGGRTFRGHPPSGGLQDEPNRTPPTVARSRAQPHAVDVVSHVVVVADLPMRRGHRPAGTRSPALPAPAPPHARTPGSGPRHLPPPRPRCSVRDVGTCYLLLGDPSVPRRRCRHPSMRRDPARHGHEFLSLGQSGATWPIKEESADRVLGRATPVDAGGPDEGRTLPVCTSSTGQPCRL